MTTNPDATADAAPSQLSVLVLAGGKSSRMGQDKAQLHYRQVPLLTRTCLLGQTIAADVAVLSPWPERYTSLLPDGVNNLLEANPGQGPLRAMHQGLGRCKTEWLLLLACDMPFLERDRICRWQSNLAKLPPSCLAYVPRTEINGSLRWEPLCGFYNRRSLSDLAQFLDQGGRSFQDWLGQTSARAITVEADKTRMFFNCNTPDDWQAIS